LDPGLRRDDKMVGLSELQHPHELADDLVLRHEASETAVARIVSIIAEHEEITLGHRGLEIQRRSRRDPGDRRLLVLDGLGCKLILKPPDLRTRSELDVHWNGSAIDRELPSLQGDVLARQPEHAMEVHAIAHRVGNDISSSDARDGS